MDNTVGSLTKDQQSIIVGSLLGDGTMRKKVNAYLEINHSIKQRSLVEWKFWNFVLLTRSDPKARKGNGDRIAYRFMTRSLPVLTPFYDLFYQEGRKRIPINLQLTPLALAVWYMDDGSKSRSSAYLNTQQFAIRDQKILSRVLRNLGIDTTLNRDKQYYRLRIRTRSIPRLKSLIEKYILDDFKYKLP